ncbi:MAG: cation:proton antiporter [Proteobacteria bacterium]|nr:cation:proton antiporter [Pseudomonadota bacterium]
MITRVGVGVAVVGLSAQLACAATNPATSVLTEEMKVEHWRGLALILIAVMAVVAICRKFKIDAFVGEIATGVLLGTVVAHLFPQVHSIVLPSDTTNRALLEHLGELGVVFLLLQSGMEIHPKEARKHGRAALWVGAGGLIIPVLLGWAATIAFVQFVPFTPTGGQSPHLFGLFMGNTMAISAMVIIVRVFKALDMTNTELGKVVLCAYAVNDILGWLIYGAIFQVAAGGSANIAIAVVRMVVAVALTWVALRWVPGWLDRWLGSLPGALRQTRIYTVVVALTLGLGVVTDYLGVTMYYGVFLAGMVLAGSAHINREIEARLTTLTEQVMCPIYFVLIGTQLNFSTGWSWPWVLFIAVGGLLLKFAGAYLCAMFAGRPRKEWYAIGVACVPGGVNGVVFGSLALSYGLINDQILGGIVASAALSSWVVGPWLKRATRQMEGKKPLKLADIVAPGLRDELPRCDAPSREVALDRRILDKVGGAVGIKAGELRQVLDQAKRTETRLVPQVAYLHGQFKIDREMIFIFWSGKDIPWGDNGETVRFVFVRLIPPGEVGITMQRQVFAFLQRIAVAKLHELGTDERSREKIHAELLRVITEIDGAAPPQAKTALPSKASTPHGADERGEKAV